MATLVDLRTTIYQGKFQSLNRYIIQRILGRFFPGSRERPVTKSAFSVLLAAIFVLLLLLGIAGNALFGTPQVDQQVFSIFMIGVIYIYILCVVIEYQIDNSLKTVQDSLLDSLVSEQDRQQLQESMDTIFSVGKQFWFGIIFSVFVHAAFIVIDPSLVAKFGTGFLIVNIVFHAFHGFCVYFYVAYLSWAISDLKNYQYDLFELDPSNTEIIGKLAILLQSTISIMTLMVASGTIIASTTRVLPFVGVAGMVVFMWINTLTLYLVNQHILKSIILRAKWEKLRKIQAQIRELESKAAIPAKETLDHITQLKEYHDKIKSTPDSPWDFARFLGTMNTLIWPTLGVIASNVDGFLDMLKKLSSSRLP
jgi:hypothetical protein